MTTERDLTNADNLAANQRGLITNAQRAEAARLSGWPGCFGALVVLLLVVLGGLLALAFRIALDPNSGLGLEPTSSLGAVVVPALILAFTWIPAGWYVLRISVKRMLTRQDLAAGKVQQGDGAIVWLQFRHIYAIELPGRKRWYTGTVVRLPPGPYRFYYLPSSGYVLSAHALPEQDVTTTLNHVLQRVLRFSANDLEHNHTGQLSPSQRLRLLAIVAGVGLIFILVGTHFVGNLTSPGVTWISLAIEAALLALLIVGGWRPTLDLIGGKIAQVEGLGARATSGDGSAYVVRVGNETLRVSLWVYQGVVPGQTYRAYFTPHDRRLLALEAVSS